MSEQQERYNETWFQNKWRPTIAYSYVLITMFDFIVAPAAIMVARIFFDVELAPWNPLTLQGNGMYVMFTASILGITSYSRGLEKIKGAAGKK